MNVGILNNLYIHLFPIPKKLFSKDYFAVCNNTLRKNWPLLPGKRYGGPCSRFSNFFACVTCKLSHLRCLTSFYAKEVRCRVKSSWFLRFQYFSKKCWNIFQGWINQTSGLMSRSTHELIGVFHVFHVNIIC